MRRWSLLISLAVAACGDDGGGGSPDARTADAEVPDAEASGCVPAADPEAPQTLAETCLCVDAACTQISADVHEYLPEYALWSDGAEKRRWIYLPAGAQIDTSDMDYWQFPEGTKLWKEFVRDGVRVETRLLQKIGPNPTDWYRASFAWNEAQTEAVATPFGAEDVLGTTHDIPSRSDCRKCHDQLAGAVLGFQAILLDHGGPGVTLAGAIEMGWLSAPPSSVGSEYFPIPGDATAQAALGYLHVNCGGCHNPTSTVQNTVPVDWRLTVGTLATVEGTRAYTTAVGVAPTLTNVTATSILEPGAPDQSSAYLRMTTSQAATQMPPDFGREVVDADGAAALAAWIDAL